MLTELPETDAENETNSTGNGRVILFKNIEILFEFWLVTAKSGLPSPFSSPIETKLGEDPVVKSALAEKVGVEAPGVVVFRNTEILLEVKLAVVKSGFPSPFKSPIETEKGATPVVKSVLTEKLGVEAPGVVVFKNTDTLAEFELGTTKSGLPSPLRSPIETERGLVPVVKSVLAEKVGVEAPGVVVFKNTETLLEPQLPTAKSGLPSPLRSPIERERGLLPVVKSALTEKVGVEAPGVVVFKNTETLVELALATAKSGLPSPLRSPIETDTGVFPVVKSVLAEKLGVDAPGVVVFKNTETLVEFWLAVAKSGLSSPLKSPIKTERGLVPVVKSVLTEKLGVEAPGVVVFKNTETLFELKLVTVKSDLPSPFISPMEMEIGAVPVVESTLVEKDVGVEPMVVVFKNTEIVLELPLPTTISIFPSPLKSPVATGIGFVPVVKLFFVSNVDVIAPGDVVFRYIETVLELPLVIAISNFPSPFKSLSTTVLGLLPVVESTLAEKEALAAPIEV